MTRTILLAAGVWLASWATAAAYPVANAISLDELAKQSDVVIKGVVESSGPVEDKSFDKVQGFRPYATKLKVVAVLQGKLTEKTIEFRHYGPADEGVGLFFMPQWYKFEPGRAYLVFAKKTDKESVFRQLWQNHRSQADQGQLLCADDEVRKGPSLKDLVWQELAALVKSDRAADVTYGLQHLDAMSGGSYDELREFERKDALKLAAPLLKNKDETIVRSAIRLLASNNPYMSDDYAAGWLATVGQGDIPGYGEWKRNTNLGGQLYADDLAGVVGSQAPAALRAMAVRALGRAEKPELLKQLTKWSSDPEPLVRQAALVVMADYPAKADLKLLQQSLDDPEPLVRTGAAQAAGFGQFKELIPQLGKLLNDKEPRVHKAAAMSLLSFSLDHSREALEANVKHPQYRALFVNALAKPDPEPYLTDLAEIVRKKLEPEDWWGGRIPWGVSWELLMKHARKVTRDDPNAANLTLVLDALEYPASGDAKGPQFYSSSEPRDLYALYVQRGMKPRAEKFRAVCKKAITYDIDYYFKMVDENPSQYVPD
jgi:HEAT repeat protein